MKEPIPKDLFNILACPICNMAKSDKFSYDEFKQVGEVIGRIWRDRKRTRTSD